MFDINGSEFLLLLIVAVVIVGPERLPKYAEQLGSWVRTLRGVLKSTKARVDEELGDNGADVDWTALDPRRYDPRRIVREALLDDSPPERRTDGNGVNATKSANGAAAGALAGAAAANAASATASTTASTTVSTTSSTTSSTADPVADPDGTTAETDVTSGAPYDDEAT